MVATKFATTAVWALVMSRSDLNTLLQYRNQRVLDKFKRDYPALADKAEGLFVEMLKYLWLAQKQQQDFSENPNSDELNFLCAIYDDMIDVDNMWHTFILHTQDYHDFCDKYFGLYLHHIPDALQDIPKPWDEFARDLSKYVAYVYDNLGDTTARLWFGLSPH